MLSLRQIDLDPFLESLGHRVKRVILGYYWDDERAAKMRVKTYAPTIIIFLAPRIMNTMTNLQSVNPDTVETIRRAFPDWQVSIDLWHHKQTNEVYELLIRDVPLTPQSFLALDADHDVLNEFMDKNTFFTGAIPLMNNTGKELESLLLIAEHVGISCWGESAPDFSKFSVSCKVYEGKVSLSVSDDEESQSVVQANTSQFSTIRQGSKISLNDRFPQKPFCTLGFVGPLPWSPSDPPICITAGHQFLTNRQKNIGNVVAVFNVVDEDKFGSTPPRKVGEHRLLGDFEDIEVPCDDSSKSFKVTVDIAHFPLETTNFSAVFETENDRQDTVSVWHTWESLFSGFDKSLIKSISKRGGTTGWKAKIYKKAPKNISTWKKDYKFFMSGGAVCEKEETDGEGSEEEDSKRSNIQKRYHNQLAFSFVSSDVELSRAGDSGSCYRDQDNKLLGFQSCLIESESNGISLATIVPAPAVREMIEHTSTSLPCSSNRS